MSALARMQDPSVRRSIEDEIERLISLLDLAEPDPDFEPWLAGGAEVCGADDREGDGCDGEASLGWSAGTNQEAALAGARADISFFDGELDAGDAPEPADDGETVMWPENLKSQEVLVGI
jgi:hypothetical protein